MVIHPTRKVPKRLRDALDNLFGYLDQSDRSRHDEVVNLLFLSLSTKFFLF